MKIHKFNDVSEVPSNLQSKDFTVDHWLGSDKVSIEIYEYMLLDRMIARIKRFFGIGWKRYKITR